MWYVLNCYLFNRLVIYLNVFFFVCVYKIIMNEFKVIVYNYIYMYLAHHSMQNGTYLTAIRNPIKLNGECTQEILALTIYEAKTKIKM